MAHTATARALWTVNTTTLSQICGSSVTGDDFKLINDEFMATIELVQITPLICYDECADWGDGRNKDDAGK